MTQVPESYFSLSKDDQIALLETAASDLGRPPDLLEKDIWVVWALNALFDSSLGESLVFKGGTSLSKAYNAIDRFSEDVDVTYDIRKIIPELVDGADQALPPNRSQAGKWSAAIEKLLPEWLDTAVIPIIQAKIKNDGLSAKLRRVKDKLYLDYDAVQKGSDYVEPAVLLEFGARSTGEPAELRDVTCDLEGWNQDISLPKARPRVMKAERTFWEKATAIHAYCLRGAFRGGDRYARHWYDLDRLDHVGIGLDALNDRELANKVASHKQIFFRETDRDGNVIDYSNAVSGKLCLVPKGKALEALRDDYTKMIESGLFQGDVLGFDELMGRLAQLQQRANS
jgi:hypothetical protein